MQNPLTDSNSNQLSLISDLELTLLLERQTMGLRLGLPETLKLDSGISPASDLHGLTWKRYASPFSMAKTSPYFSESEELEVLLLIRSLFYHPNIEWVFQNGLYDFQYFLRRWLMCPRTLFMDTMVSHHVMFPGDLPKGLDFIASLHCDFYRFWKEDGKEWDPKRVDEYSHWKYNCRDCVNTLEAANSIEVALHASGLWDQHTFQHRRFWVALDMMLRGVLTDPPARKEIAKECDKILEKKRAELAFIVDREDFNPNSHIHMKHLFYEELKVRKRYKIVKDKKKGD